MTRKDSTGSQIGATTFDYDEFARQARITDARNGTTTNVFDALDRIVATHSPAPASGQASQVTGFKYDRLGRVEAVTNADNTVTYKEFFDTGELKKTWGSRTYPVEYTYDYSGRMKTMKTWQDFAGNSGTAVTTWNYDAYRGFMTNKAYADGKGPSYRYTPAGRLYLRTWARGVMTAYGTNSAGDVALIIYSDGTPGVTNTFDRLGRKTQVQDGIGTHGFIYDLAGRLLVETNSAGLLAGTAVTNAYDSLGRRVAVGLVGEASMVAQYGYDGASRLNGVTNDYFGTFVATYSYVANSPLLSDTAFSRNGSGVMTTTRQYDYLNRLTNIVNTPASASAASFQYPYNTANQRTRATEADSSGQKGSNLNKQHFVDVCWGSCSFPPWPGLFASNTLAVGTMLSPAAITGSPSSAAIVTVSISSNCSRK